MNPDLLVEAKALWDRQEKAQRFENNLGVYPITEGKLLVDGFHRLAEVVPEVSLPATLEEVYETELKRRAFAEVVYLDHVLSGRTYTFEDVVDIYGIEESDIDDLRPWLDANRQITLDAVERIFQDIPVDEYHLSLPMDLPGIRRQSEEFVQQRVTTYHRRMSLMFSRLTGVGGFLREIDSVVTTDPRSYFSTVTKTLAISIPAVCYQSEDGLPVLRERELIRLFGHEGFGHGCNKVLTDEAKELPFFLKITSGATIATLESVAQFYEKQVFEDLRNNPDIQRWLDIAHIYDDLYKEEKDTQLIQAYKLKFFQYGIVVLANGPQDQENLAAKSKALEEVALYPGSARSFIETNRYNFDSQGNLNPQLVSELRYAAQPAHRVISTLQSRGFNYAGEGRTKIDTALLQGFWTPVGIVERAQVI